MHPRSSLSEQQRAAAIVLFTTGLGRDAVASRLQVSPHVIKTLHDRWRLYGEDALVTKATRRSFSFETKQTVVLRFRAGESKIALAQEFELSSPQLVGHWDRAYRDEGEDGLRPKRRGRPQRDPDTAMPEPSEVEQLRQENERLRAEVAYLGKLRALMAPKRR
jgi:transposase-like protein